MTQNRENLLAVRNGCKHDPQIGLDKINKSSLTFLVAPHLSTSSWTSITHTLQTLALEIAYNMVSFSSLSRIRKSTLHPRSNLLADQLSQQDMSWPTRKGMAVAWALAKKALHAPPNYHP